MDKVPSTLLLDGFPPDRAGGAHAFVLSLKVVLSLCSYTKS